MPNALGPVVLIKEMPLTWNTRMAIMDLAKFSNQKGSKPKNQQFRESHLKIVSLLVFRPSVRPSSVVVFKNFCSFSSSQFPSAVKRATFGLPGCARNYLFHFSKISNCPPNNCPICRENKRIFIHEGAISSTAKSPPPRTGAFHQNSKP